MHLLVAELERLVEARLAHPALVAPLEAGICDVSAYLAQEYVAAESLDITLRHGPISLAETLAILRSLAGALDSAAAVGVAHGAMHPRDILLSADEARLTGIGIAGALERVGVGVPVRRPYMAPETAAAGEWDRRADVFGAAAIAFEILCGHRLTATGDDVAATLTDIPEGDPERLRAVFARALADRPDQRYATATGFVDELAAAFSALARPAAVVSVPPVMQAIEPPAAPAIEPLPEPAIEPLPEPVDIPFLEAPFLDEPIAEPELARATYSNPVVLPDLPIESDAPVRSGLPLHSLEAARPVHVPDADRFVEVDPDPPLIANALPTPERPIFQEPARSAISPLAFALLIGAALGFTAGFGVGAWSRTDGSAGTTVAEQGGTSTSPDSRREPRDFTESTVAGQEAPARAEEIRPDPLASSPPSPAPSQVATPSRSQTPQPASRTAAVSGQLLVRSTPLGARVMVDGREHGRTPVTVANLSRGAHIVRVVREGYLADERRVTITPAQRTQSMTVRLLPDRPAPVSQPVNAATSGRAVGELSVESRPAGANVFVDGRLVGTTPLLLPDVAAGEHAIHLERDGYKRWASAVRIVAAERSRVAASLDQ